MTLCSVWLVLFPVPGKSIVSFNIVLLHSKGATDVKVTADVVKAALEEAEKAQNAAEKAIKQADEDIKGTQDLLTSVSSLSISWDLETAPSLIFRNWYKSV